MSLKKKTLNGLFWVALEKVGLHVIQFGVFILLARLLAPADFGLIAMIMILFSVSSVIIGGGINQALIREKTLEKNDVDTAFFTNVLLGSVFYMILYVTAPYVSLFYGDVRLTVLVKIMGLAVLFNSIGLVFSASLIQRMDFRRELVIMLPAYLISGGIAIYLAYSGFGVIALAVKYTTLELVKTLFLISFSKQKIGLSYNKDSFKKLVSFGIHLTGSKIISSTHENLYKVLIGKFFSPTVLGLYTQAQKIMQLLSANILQAIQKVTYPTLSKIKDDDERLKAGYRKIIQLSMLIIMPMMSLLIVSADPLIPYLLGEQWMGAVPMLQIISLGGMVFYLILIHQNLLQVKGRTDVYFKLELVQKFNVTIALVAGLWFNILILISLIVASQFVTTFIYAYKVGKFIDYKVSEQFKDIADIFVVSLLVLGFTYMIKLGIAQFEIHELILLITLAISTVFIFVGIGIAIKSKKIELIKEYF